MAELQETTRYYLQETGYLIAELRRNPKNYYGILKYISMTKDNSHILGYISIYKLYKALEDVYKALCDKKLAFSENLNTLILLVADKIEHICLLIKENPSAIEDEDIHIYLLYCDKAVAGEIFDAKIIVAAGQKKQAEEKKQVEEIKKPANEFVRISSQEISKIITLHEEMIARTYIISNQVSMLKSGIADKNIHVLQDVHKLLANDSQSLQSSLQIAHESFMNLVQDENFLKNHQEYQGFFVLSNGEKFLIPSNYIFDVICESPLNYSIKQNQKIVNYVVENESGIKDEEKSEEIPVYSLSSLFPDQKAKTQNILDTILIVNYQNQKIGIIVDQVQKFVSVIKKPMPAAFEKFVPVQGLAFDEKYDMIPILHVPEIMRRFRALRGYDVKKFEALTKKHINKILIVDDSQTTRQIQKTILLSNNYIVDEAQDGIEAIEKMKHKQFDLILTDDEMPRMNGAILLDNIRRMENYSNVPVVVMADKPLEKADAFVNKSDFTRDKLIETLKRMLEDE
ncbi:MAG: response regulator [Treponema sp.]|nr:response regulator [Treponema sp.]